MKKIDLKIVFRNLIRNKLHSLINIIGFAIGIAVFILIMVYANYKLSFDKFHYQKSHIYKAYIGKYDQIPAPIAKVLKDNNSEIVDYVRTANWYGGGVDGFFKTDNITLNVNDLLFADSIFFDFFDFKLLQGNKSKALQTPNSIILTKSYALKIFGDINPINRRIKYISKANGIKYNLTVLGIIEDTPSNSSIVYNGLISMITIKSNGVRNGNIDEDWSNWGFSTYIKVRNKQSTARVYNEILPFWTKFVEERWDVKADSERAKEFKLNLVPLDNIHYYNNNKISFIYLIILIGIIILIVAIINYVNLSLAISNTRISEIGIRKVTGSNQSRLFWQFINESIIMTFLSSVLALFILYATKSYFFEITGCNYLVQPDQIINSIILFVISVIVIGLISGIYPALYLVALKPVTALKKENLKGQKGQMLKNTLIVFQFVISIVLIVSVIAISDQVKYMKTKNLGFESDHIVYFGQSKNISEKYDAFKQTLLKNVNILNITRTNGPLGRPYNISAKHKMNGDFKSYKANTVDPDFIKTFGVELIKGRDFSWNNGNDINNTAIVNECFIKEFELNPEIGSEISFLGRNITIIGVIKDFHNSSLHHVIEPAMLCYLPWNACINIKISDNDIQSTIALIKKTWNVFSPEVPFEYQFLEKTYNDLYKSEAEFNVLIKIFSILAVCIASLGLFGLVSFTVNQRKKEIGIRKINGAKINEIVSMLNRDITKWVLIAFVIACPIAYYGINVWLENYAYRIEISWWFFALAGFIVLTIAFITVSWQSWRAASMNPVEALRYE